jgi:hypothetical protein
MDKNKNVIFHGSPIASEEKWKSFTKLLKRKNKYEKHE